MGVLGWEMNTQQHVNLLGWGSSFQEISQLQNEGFT